MLLSHLLTRERVQAPVDALDKADVLRALSRLLTAGVRGMSSDHVYRVLWERERLASTGVGQGVAIPHARLATAPGLLGAMVICPQGVRFDSLDGGPTYIFLALVAPEAHPSEQLRALARVARILKNDMVREKLLEASTAGAALDVIVAADRGL